MSRRRCKPSFAQACERPFLGRSRFVEHAATGGSCLQRRQHPCLVCSNLKVTSGRQLARTRSSQHCSIKRLRWRTVATEAIDGTAGINRKWRGAAIANHVSGGLMPGSFASLLPLRVRLMQSCSFTKEPRERVSLALIRLGRMIDWLRACIA